MGVPGERMTNESTRYFYNNQRIQNTFPQIQGNNEFLNKARFNYNQIFRYPNPNEWLQQARNQILRNSNKQQIERNSKLPELICNVQDGRHRRELEDIKPNKQEIIKANKNLYQERRGQNRKLELNPNTPDFIGSRKQNEVNENITLQHPIKCDICGGKGHM